MDKARDHDLHAMAQRAREGGDYEAIRSAGPERRAFVAGAAECIDAVEHMLEG